MERHPRIYSWVREKKKGVREGEGEGEGQRGRLEEQRGMERRRGEERRGGGEARERRRGKEREGKGKVRESKGKLDRSFKGLHSLHRDTSSPDKKLSPHNVIFIFDDKLPRCLPEIHTSRPQSYLLCLSPFNS